MKTTILTIFSILYIISLAACRYGTLPAATPQVTPTGSPTQVSTPTPTPTRLPIPDRAQYQIRADFDYAQHILDVIQTVVYPNHSSDTISELLFMVEPNRLGNFTLQSLSVNGVQVQNFTLDADQLRVPLATPLTPETAVTVAFSYQIILPVIPTESADYKPVPYGYTDRQTNLVDWYCFLPPYQSGKGWLVHEPSFYGEFLVYDKADFDVTINPVGDTVDYVIAASSLSEQTGLSRHYTLANARNFAWSASPDYLVKTTQVGSIIVNSYTFPTDEKAGQQVLTDTSTAMALYSRLFTAYPHQSLTVVEADFLDGMEYDGLYFLSRGFYNLYDGTPQGYLTAIAVHETAHQWWFGLVGNDQALDSWLDEAFATYSEKLYYENIYPNLLSWWWSARVDYYQPAGYINRPIIYYGGFRPYRDAVYLNGACFLDELRQTIGDDVFFAVLKDYLARYTDKIAATQDFFTVVSDHTSMDLSALKAKYFLPEE